MAARSRRCEAGAHDALPAEAWSVSSVTPGRAPSAKCRVPRAVLGLPFASASGAPASRQAERQDLRGGEADGGAAAELQQPPPRYRAGEEVGRPGRRHCGRCRPRGGRDSCSSFLSCVGVADVGRISWALLLAHPRAAGRRRRTRRGRRPAGGRASGPRRRYPGRECAPRREPERWFPRRLRCRPARPGPDSWRTPWYQLTGASMLGHGVSESSGAEASFAGVIGTRHLAGVDTASSR